MLKGKGLHALWVATMTLLAVSLAGTAMADTNHKISKGDTVYSIAKHYGVSVGSIQKANGLTDRSILTIGRILQVPEAAHKHQSTTEKAESASTDQASGPECEISNQTEAQPQQKASPDTKASESNDPRSSELVSTAFRYRGSRYRFGGTSRGGFDCSGFTRYVYAKYGIALPHSSSSQFSLGHPVSKSELKQGDLVFFSTRTRGISHVGIYIGDNKFIHASNVRRGVTVDSLSSAYYAPRYRGARRVK